LASGLSASCFLARAVAQRAMRYGCVEVAPPTLDQHLSFV